MHYFKTNKGKSKSWKKISSDLISHCEDVYHWACEDLTLTSKFNDIRSYALFFLSIYLIVSFADFSTDDYGWTSVSDGEITNSGGVFGAYISDISLTFFGLMAYLCPISILGYVFLNYKNRHKKNDTITFASIVKWIVFFATLFSGAALLYMYAFRIRGDLPRSTGGIAGEELGHYMISQFGNTGATLFLLFTLISGLTMLTGLSVLQVIDFLGKHTVIAIDGALKFYFKCKINDFFIEKYSLAYDSLKKTPISEKEVDKIIVKKSAIKSSNISEDIRNKADHLKNKASEKIFSLTESFKTIKIADKIEIIPVKDKGKSSKILPSSDFLNKITNDVVGYSDDELQVKSRMVEAILDNFKISVKVVGIQPGPIITRFELDLAPGTKASRVSGLETDLARALKVSKVRIVEVIPGKSFVGLEIPNKDREMVSFKDLIESSAFKESSSPLTLALGKDISGRALVSDLGKMPHVLVAGTTGSGKSVAINTMILSMLYKATPKDVRLIMIDPKMLELSVYEGIPHLLTPVVTDMKEANNALKWAVDEMERRYKLMSKVGVRNLASFNQMIADNKPITNPMNDNEILEHLPYIVVVIDELADMMMVVGKKVEENIARLAQKARASGIHLILATQRPSVDVLTGLIKANVPTRISFQVSSRIDSRTIIDQSGAEALLGNGDMLFLPSGTVVPIRAHGAFVDDGEVHRIVEFLKTTGSAIHIENITKESSSDTTMTREFDILYHEAVEFVIANKKASISSLQRKFKVGYNRAANIIEEMERSGVVSLAESNGSRTVLVS